MSAGNSSARNAELQAANEALRASRVAALNLMEDALAARRKAEEAEEALRQSEEQFRLAIKATNDAIWDINLTTGTVHWNETYATVFGRPPETEDSWQWWIEHIHPEDRDRTAGALRAAIDGQATTWTREYRLLRADGTWADIYDRAYIARDASGKASRVVGAMLDLTERKRAEEKIAGLNQDLQRRVAELQAIFETAPIGLAIAEDAEGQHIRGNPANERMFGVDRGGELSKAGPRPAGFRCLHDGRELAVTELPMQRAVRGETVSGQMMDAVREDGQSFALYSSAAPLFDEMGKPRGAVGAFLDITSLKRAEERTRLLSEVTAQLLASDQPQRIVEALCRKVMDYLGCQVFFNFLVDEQGQHLRLNACAGVPEEAARQIESLDFGVAVCGCVARDGCRIVAEHIQTTPDSRTDLVRSFGVQAYACHPLLNQGQVIGTLSFGSRGKPTFADDELALMKAVADHVAIAMQRVRLLESLERHARAAEAANEAKGQFLANMSHELRTPMNAILGMIDVALPKAVDPTVQDCLQTAKGSADLLLTLLNDLLDSAKIESGKLELESAPFSLRRMLDQITRVLAVRASEKGLCFCCRMPDQTPDAVTGDRMRLQQVLLNLAGNAIKFTERGDVEISLHVSSLPSPTGRGAEGEGGAESPSPRAVPPCPRPPIEGRSLPEREGTVTLEFAVRDTGIGIPPSGLERLFQPFAQADASMARRFGGTGLGLSISKSLVEMMDGRIWAESEVGRGSTFYFTVRLPLAKEPPADFETPVALPTAARARLRILLVEDNPANQKLATYILQDRGHLVEIAGNGQEAICLTEQNCYDVILMDVQMPVMGGLEATAAIRKRENGSSRVPIIAMTAHAMTSDRERCLTGGMDAYLSKPIDGHEMIALVERLAEERLGIGDSGLERGNQPVVPKEASIIPNSLSLIPSSDPEFALKRRKAEERLRAGKMRPAFAVSEADARALVHELQVYHIELEMQNEELQRAQATAEAASARYCDLFDFAPVAYFLWDHQGRIVEVNLAGAALLGLNRDAVIHKRFGQFVAVEYRARFADFCHRVLLADAKQTCEVKILRDPQAVDALIEGIASQDRQGQEKLCRAAVIDIGQRKRAEELAAANSSKSELPADISREIRAPQAVAPPAAPVFDPELALKRCFNKPKIVWDMIRCFFDEVDSVFPQMRTVLDKGDLQELGRLGHRLKGTLVYLGAEAARDAAQAVEKFEWQAGDRADAEEAINALEKQCELFKAALVKHQATAGSQQAP